MRIAPLAATILIQVDVNSGLVNARRRCQVRRASRRAAAAFPSLSDSARYRFRQMEGDVTPRQTVERWVALFNAADAAGLADLYHPDAVNHQVTQAPVEGREAIHAMFVREFASAEMHCMVEAIHEAGDVVALEWRDPLGLRGCGFFTVQDGRISFQRGYWDRLSFLRMHGLPIG